ncbi:FKBP-type peptidyl-prolyl cis-trans isomerase [Chitinophaga sancti]|uniref:Peptidyl-prolyl cis-trans isomerase n=1 Tax=Chitinophaga sancti TaxID=1004 RepID=A0A1K1QLN1_9BACT|nr:peptidylprolyl isomerase [Chitinophaga sancti]WQD65134.1 peptidylprolyl isomerase [Chitinophaga sancti]WQG89242.1 peptidylprolyl isomerase [Chitinophaga sancti]SFW60685.1 peptidylprolyl isomerase [Chitinophaga sancti]
MQAVKNGDKVRVHYHGRLTNGTTFDSSEGRDPLEFEVGAGMVIKGFDNGVVDMKVGEKKTLNIPVEEAYGPKNDELIMDFPKENIPADLNPQVGMELQMSNPQGQVFPVKVAAISTEFITLDANHPLAGEPLVFDIELVEIV